MNKFFLNAASALLSMCLLLPGLARSEDIDIYSGVDGSGGKPNVLFFLDNTSNWANSSQAWNKDAVTAKCNAITNATKKSTCLGYVSQIFGTSSSLGWNTRSQET